MSMGLKQQSYARGVTYLVLAGLFMSTSGLFVRMIEDAHPWTVLFYRSITFGICVLIFMAVRGGESVSSQFKSLNRLDVIVSVSVGISFILYLLSLFNTSVANTVIIVSTGPLFAAALGWMVLKEKVSVTTWVSIMLAVAGMLVMFTGEITRADILGMIFALFAVVCFAIMIVTVRLSSKPDMLAATACAGPVAAAISFFAAPTLAISSHDLLVAVCLGSIQIGFGFILITLGSKSVPSAQVPILCLFETVLAPLWVWFSVRELPTESTWIGGALILAAVLYQGLMGINRRRRQRRAAA